MGRDEQVAKQCLTLRELVLLTLDRKYFGLPIVLLCLDVTRTLYIDVVVAAKVDEQRALMDVALGTPQCTFAAQW